jgi:2-octaprenyl-6-methoxyphenol hydroxylase
MPFNVSIVGGGMVGAALAVALKNTSLQIALIEASSMPLAEDLRLIALNDSSIRLFENIGVWSALKSYATPIEQIHVSHRGHFGMTRIDCKELNLRALGYVVPAKYINTALYSALEGAQNIKLIHSTKVCALRQMEEGVSLDITSDFSIQTLKTDVVIGADGSFSTVRDLLGIAIHKVDYEQSALVTATILKRDHKNIAYERFQTEGAIAMLPLSFNRAATIWTASNEMVAHLMTLTEDEFLTKLQTFFGYRLGRFLSIEKRSTYPLQMIQTKQPLKQNVLLIGNAAHTFHPIAAQGLNLALYEVAHVANYLQNFTEKVSFKHLPIDSLQENFSKNLSHHLTWLFSSEFFVFNIARPLGLLGLDVLPGLKKRFALQAMGKNRSIPFRPASVNDLQKISSD